MSFQHDPPAGGYGEMAGPTYRVYFLDPEGHIVGPPRLLSDCPDDKAAIQQAEQLLDGQDIELWDRKRLVIKLPRVSE